MKKRYYTPEKKEFHIGFQYEAQDMLPSGAAVDYFPKVFTEENVLYSVFQTNAWYDKPRVKILDIEDIEEIGIPYIGGKMISDGPQYFKGKVEKGYWLHLTCTFLSYTTIVRIETSVLEDSVKTLVVHSIGMKNISEFKRLLKQLNITCLD